MHHRRLRTLSKIALSAARFAAKAPVTLAFAVLAAFTIGFGCGGRTQSEIPNAGNPNDASGSGTGTDDGSANKNALLFGGLMGANGPSYVGTWLWNGNAWTRTGWNPPEIDSAPDADSSQISMSTFKGVPMLFGVGPTVEQQLGSGSWQTWKWEDETWLQSALTPISLRSGFAVAPWNGKIVVFGGLLEDGTQANDYLADLWTFDGTTWLQQPAVGPSGRANSMMASLGTTVVLFGGSTNSDADASTGGASGTMLSDTWTWDGTDWAQRSSIGPSARAEAVFAPLHGQLILFGGETADGNVSSETWSWNGSAWSSLDVTGPSARRGAVMTPVAGKLLLFGGLDASGVTLADTWTFDGSNWTRLGVGGPPGLVSAAMAGF